MYRQSFFYKYWKVNVYDKMYKGKVIRNVDEENWNRMRSWEENLPKEYKAGKKWDTQTHTDLTNQ
jgi:hypothetical protein